MTSNQPTNPSGVGQARNGAWPLPWNLPPGATNGSTTPMPNGSPFEWRPVFQHVSMPLPAPHHPTGSAPLQMGVPIQDPINAAQAPDPLRYSRVNGPAGHSGPSIASFNPHVNVNIANSGTAAGVGQRPASPSSQYVVEVALNSMDPMTRVATIELANRLPDMFEAAFEVFDAIPNANELEFYRAVTSKPKIGPLPRHVLAAAAGVPFDTMTALYVKIYGVSMVPVRDRMALAALHKGFRTAHRGTLADTAAVRPPPPQQQAVSMPRQPSNLIRTTDTATPTASLPDRRSVPESLEVACNGLRGTFYIRSQTIHCHCEQCTELMEALKKERSRTTPPAISPVEFERHAGMQNSKKWRNSIRVADEPLSLGQWLDREGIVIKYMKAGKDDKLIRGADEKLARINDNELPKPPPGKALTAQGAQRAVDKRKGRPVQLPAGLRGQEHSSGGEQTEAGASEVKFYDGHDDGGKSGGGSGMLRSLHNTANDKVVTIKAGSEIILSRPLDSGARSNGQPGPIPVVESLSGGNTAGLAAMGRGERPREGSAMGYYHQNGPMQPRLQRQRKQPRWMKQTVDPDCILRAKPLVDKVSDGEAEHEAHDGLGQSRAGGPPMKKLCVDIDALLNAEIDLALKRGKQPIIKGWRVDDNNQMALTVGLGAVTFTGLLPMLHTAPRMDEETDNAHGEADHGFETKESPPSTVILKDDSKDDGACGGVTSGAGKLPPAPPAVGTAILEALKKDLKTPRGVLQGDQATEQPGCRGGGATDPGGGHAKAQRPSHLSSEERRALAATEYARLLVSGPAPGTKCVMCHLEEVDAVPHSARGAGGKAMSGLGGFILVRTSLVSNAWVHDQCARWSPEVYDPTGDGALDGVKDAVRRGRMLRCKHCGERGATLGCLKKTCKASYHLPCARKHGCLLSVEPYVVACPGHEDQLPGGLSYKLGYGRARRMRPTPAPASNMGPSTQWALPREPTETEARHSLPQGRSALDTLGDVAAQIDE